MNSVRGEEAEFAILKQKKITMRGPGPGTKMKFAITHTFKQRQQGY